MTSALLHGPAGRTGGSYLAGLDLDSGLVSGDVGLELGWL